VHYFAWILVGFIAALYVAWNNGSNNAPNSVGTAVGAGILDVRRALILAATMSLIGSLTLGIYVTNTVMKGIVHTIGLPPYIVIKGMISVLLATGTWTLISTFFKVPMSVHVCVIGGLIGFGLAAGYGTISWTTVTIIFIAWIIAPAAAALTAYFLYAFYGKAMREEALSRLAVITASFITILAPTLLVLLKNASSATIAWGILVTTIVSSIGSLLIYYYWKRRITRGGDRVYEASRILLILAAAGMAYSFGSNDVANSAGPLAAILYAGGLGSPAAVYYALITAAVGLGLGIFLWGEKIMGTIGEKITPLTPSTAFVAQLSATLTMLIVSRLGLPVSSSMAIVGGITGVGAYRGIRNVNMRLLIRIFSIWLLALPVTIALSYVLSIIFWHLP
jgi:PiT family inorganic phosphate transporter